MAIFKENLFFEKEVKESISKLRGSMVPVKAKPGICINALENLISLYHRRQSLLRTSFNKPFLFSELRELLYSELGKKAKSHRLPAIDVRGDFYIASRLLDFKDALFGVYMGLREAAQEKIVWSFMRREGHLVVSCRFQKRFEGFDIALFCERLGWDSKKGGLLYPGFPFLEALLENCDGKSLWRYQKGLWNLEITIPVLEG